MSALAQQHFGPDHDFSNLPGSWSSTSNALLELASSAKDALLVVDDFAPAGSLNDVQHYHREADRLLRAQGNGAGRLRLRSDARLRPARPPRGLIVSTGEDIPRGQSLRARMVLLELSPDEVKLDLLTQCQKDAAEGLYAQAVAAFIQWLAPRRERIRSKWLAKVHELQCDVPHARTARNAAELIVAMEYFLQFCAHAHALTNKERRHFYEEAKTVLHQIASAQGEQQAAVEPTQRFCQLLSSAITSGRAHVADHNGEEPSMPAAWGWRNEGDDWRPRGFRVGWLDGEDVYLDANAAFGVVQQVARDGGDSIPLNIYTLKRRLFEKRLLASTDCRGGSNRLEVRRVLQGRRRSVLHLRASAVMGRLPKK